MLATLRAELIRAESIARTSPAGAARDEWASYAAGLRAVIISRETMTA